MTKTFNQLPFLRLLIPFVAGIILQYYLNLGTWMWVVWFGLCILLCLPFLPPLKASFIYRWVFGVTLTCFCLCSAVLITKYTLSEINWVLPDCAGTYWVKILEDPVMKTRSMQCKVHIIQEWNEQNGVATVGKNAIVYLSVDSLSEKPLPGDYLKIHSLFRKPENFPGDSFFDYRMFLFQQGFVAIAFVPVNRWKIYHQASTLDIKSMALRCRRYLLDEMNRIIPDRKLFGTAAAILFGYKDDLEKSIMISFSSTGAAHVLSVSGLHVGILYVALNFILTYLIPFNRMKIFRRILVLLLIWMFAFLTGLSPSVVRSVIMLSIVGFAGIIGKKSFTLNTVGASAFLMLIYNPMYLFDISFQLSYSAVFSIVLFNPYMVRILSPVNPLLKYIWELCSVSVASQIGTFPLALYYFHQFPAYFLFTNIFVIPFTGILLLLIPLSLGIFLVSGWKGYVYFPVNKLLSLFVTGVEFIEKIPGSVIRGINIGIPEVVFIYMGLLFSTFILIHKKVVYLYFLLLFVVFLLIYYL